MPSSPWANRTPRRVRPSGPAFSSSPAEPSSPGAGSGSGRGRLGSTRWSWGTVNDGASSATWWSWSASVCRTITAAWSSPRPPARNSPLVAGNASRPRASATSRRARPGDTPQRHTTQCSGDRIPNPSQAPVRNASSIRPTSPAVTTFNKPTVSATRSSKHRWSLIVAPGVSANVMSPQYPNSCTGASRCLRTFLRTGKSDPVVGG
jgi:hypothetical protein